MFRRLPAFLKDATGKMPAAAARVDEDTWIAGWDGYFAVIDSKRREYPWSDFEAGSWDDDANVLALTFVDPRQGELIFTMPRDSQALILTMIRERIERSIVYRQVAQLPSGRMARAQVRRNRDDSLFTQIIVDGDISEADAQALDVLENELREAVGLEAAVDKNTNPEIG